MSRHDLTGVWGLSSFQGLVLVFRFREPVRLGAHDEMVYNGVQ